MTGGPMIAVDIGNSRIKLGWYERQACEALGRQQLPRPTFVVHYPTADPLPSAELTEKLPGGPTIWHVSSVNRGGLDRLSDWVKANRPADQVNLLTYRDLPLEVRVEFPERVGLDRLAAAVAANTLRAPGRPAIVVTSGTAITVNLLSAEGHFEGGAILPGYRLQAQSLFGGADQLPLTPFMPTEDLPDAVGKNTDDAIRSGLLWGTVGAVRELIGRIAHQCPAPPQVFVTGGDMQRLAAALAMDVQFIPNLVLSGIAIAAAPDKNS